MTRPPCVPVWLDNLWAKSADKGAGGQPETLAQHTWMVLERLADLIRLRPHLPHSIGVPRLWHILFWAAFLHDFGKAATGFQNRLRGGARWVHRHEVLSLAFVDWVQSAFSNDEQCWLVAAIVSHHKDAETIAELYPTLGDEEDDQFQQLIAELAPATVAGLWRWLAECAESWLTALDLATTEIALPQFPPADNAVNHVIQQGASSIRHRLKEYRRFVKRLNATEHPPFIVGTLALRGFLMNSDQSASAHAGSLPQALCRADQIMASRSLQPDCLFVHQRLAAETVGAALLTAPTGSGKTEAALLWAARQTEGGRLTRLFYALPYQASMNAMQQRLRDSFDEKLVGLQHGRSLSVLYRQLIDKDYSPQVAAQVARWSRNLADLNYPPVRVLSPYQLLKGIYRLHGYEALLSDFHGATFIFDEIHAYETRRLAMILQTIGYLVCHFNARCLIMSATFPRLIKTQLRQALNNPVEIDADQELFDAFRRHRLHLLTGELTEPENLQRVIADARGGKSVLVVCNTVDRAQIVYKQLHSVLLPVGCTVELLHGRFNVQDRLVKERIVREATGSTSSQRRPIVLVATQVVEVSLDIDLDTIYSDPAPLEALVQRFGRINRRRLQPDFAPVHVFDQPADGQGVYDAPLVIATLQILQRENGNVIDEHSLGSWLDEIYSGAVAQRWIDEFSRAAVEFEASCIRPLRAFQTDHTLEDLFYQAFDSVEVLPNDLYDDFMALREHEPIRAHDLLVPISWRRHQALARQGLLKPRDKATPPVVLTPYSPKMGLTFEDMRGEE